MKIIRTKAIDWLPVSKAGWHDLGIMGLVLGAFAVGYLAGALWR